MEQTILSDVKVNINLACENEINPKNTELNTFESFFLTSTGQLVYDIREAQLMLGTNTAYKELLRTVVEGSSTPGYVGLYNLYGETSVEWLNKIVLLTVELMNKSAVRQIVLPTEEELYNLAVWILEKVTSGKDLVVVTTICPDYWYEEDYQTGEKEYTFDGMDDGIGLIGESVLATAPQFLQLVADVLQKRIVWFPTYALFEARVGNRLLDYGFSLEQMRECIYRSSLALSEELKLQVYLTPSLLTLTVEDWENCVNSLPTDSFRLVRAGNLESDLRDWIVNYILLKKAFDTPMLLEASSISAARAGYRAAVKVSNSEGISCPLVGIQTHYKGF